MEEPKDLREEFLCFIDYSKLRLRNLPNFIFLCGGCTKPQKVDDVEIYQSMRKAISFSSLLSHADFSSKLIIAENYDDWHYHGVIKNLIDLELSIADMAAAIVVILEAPGAIAELGSFSVLERLSEKLVLVINEKSLLEDSYINLGPIKYLEEKEGKILRYSWDYEYIVKGHNKDRLSTSVTDQNIFKIADEVISDIKAHSSLIKMTNPTFHKDRLGHVCMAVADLIYNFGALKLREISFYLKEYFEIKEANDSYVKQCIYILEKFEFIEKVTNGDVYFKATNNNSGFLKYYFEKRIEGHEIKSSQSIRDNQISYYAKHDHRRLAVIYKDGM